MQNLTAAVSFLLAHHAATIAGYDPSSAAQANEHIGILDPLKRYDIETGKFVGPDPEPMAAGFFAPEWITAGWSRVDGRWIELGTVAGVGTELGAIAAPPELTVHQVADRLNALEAELAALRAKKRPAKKAAA